MKFRPQVQLRFRDEAQYVLVKDAAQAQALSVNEWILRRVENGGMQTAGDGSGHEAQVQGRAVRPVRSRSRSNGASTRKTEEQADRTEEVPAAKGGKKISTEQFLALSNSEQMRAKREGKF